MRRVRARYPPRHYPDYFGGHAQLLLGHEVLILMSLQTRPRHRYHKAGIGSAVMSFTKRILFHRGPNQLSIEIKPSYGDDDIYKGYAESVFGLLAPGEKWSGSCWLNESEMNSFLQGLILLREREGIARLSCALSPEFHIAVRPSSDDSFIIDGGMAEFSYLGEYCFPHPHSFAFEITRKQVDLAAEGLSSIPAKRPPESREPDLDFSSWIAGL